MTLTTSASPGNPRLMTWRMSEVTLTPTETCLSGLSRPGRAPAPAQTLSRYFFRSQEMRKVTRGLRDKLSNRVNIDSSSYTWKMYFSLDSHINFICSSKFHRQVRWTFHNASSEVGWKGVLYRNIFQGKDISLSLNFIFPYSSSSSQANWYKAEQFCRFHNMHLASINSEQEQRELEVRNIFLD